MELVKVYNKGKRPIVWRRTRMGAYVIHPGKYDLFGKEKAREIINSFENAVSEEDYKRLKSKPAEEKKEAGKDKE